jgi:hypothetical protein
MTVFRRIFPRNIDSWLIDAPHLTTTLSIARRQPWLSMTGGQDKLLVLMVSHFVTIDRKGIEEDGPLWLLIESTVIRSANERSRWNGDHLFLNWLLSGSGVCLRLGFDATCGRRLLIRGHGRTSQNRHDRHGGTSQYYEEKYQFKLRV